MHLPAILLVSAFISSLLLIGAPAQAADSEPIRHAIADFLNARSKNLPGPARYDIGPIKAGGFAHGCRTMDVTMDAGARSWGRTHVNVRCTEGATWSMYVPVQIHVAVEYLVSARPLRAGQTIVEADLARRRGDLADLPTGVLTDPALVLGQTSGVSLPAERPLRADMLRQPLVVKQGQGVRIVSGGAGFQVSSEGRALGNAVAGQVVQVRLTSGQVISGIAQSDGTIGVAH
ncbi:MAG: flagellar basal body P-ring formation chaperone FlgA [Sulfuritalea sp.]|nr:flagellar basal body P-ring formation chaperone FlgA [Sulfuritalea sp.]